MSSIDLSVVIPVYFAEKSLDPLVARLLPVLQKMHLQYEVIFVDDGSTDRTWEVLTELRDKHPGVIKTCRLMRNFGQHNALMCGFRKCLGSHVVTMDDDLQNPPEEIPKLYEKIKARDLDLVYGTYLKKEHAAWRNTGSAVIGWLFSQIFHFQVKPTAFRIIDKQVIQAIQSFELNYIYLDGLFAWTTTKVGSVIVNHEERSQGSSGYSIVKLLRLSINFLVNFSTFPLRLVFVGGLFAATCSFAAMVYWATKYVMDDSVPAGYSSLIMSIMLFGGLQLAAIGLAGEYIGRIMMSVNSKPQYVVREDIS